MSRKGVFAMYSHYTYICKFYVHECTHCYEPFRECNMLGNDTTEVTILIEARQQVMYWDVWYVHLLYSFLSLHVYQTLHDIEIEVQQQLQLEEQLQATQKQEEDRFQRIKHMRYVLFNSMVTPVKVTHMFNTANEFELSTKVDGLLYVHVVLKLLSI